MYPHLHIPDGFLSPQISLLLWVATAVLIGIAVRKTSRTDVRLIASQPILMGVLGAFIFAAQMFNFPVATGTSGHLLGGVLAGYLLGPWAGTIVMATVIGIQALLFQDGGLLVLGANIFNMGIIGTLGGSFVARGIGTALGGSRSASILGAGAAAWLAVVAAAGFTTLQLGLSGTTNIAVGLPAMLGVHALIGIGEALITVAALTFIARTAPDILAGVSAPRKASPVRRLAIGVVIAGGVATLASLFASADPDGLEAVAEQLGFLDAGQSAPFELFPDYTIPGLDGTASTVVAGLLGMIVVIGVLLALGRLARSRTKS
jgi:cobalt/nickel transport system permease protein